MKLALITFYLHNYIHLQSRLVEGKTQFFVATNKSRNESGNNVINVCFEPFNVQLITCLPITFS